MSLAEVVFNHELVYMTPSLLATYGVCLSQKEKRIFVEGLAGWAPAIWNLTKAVLDSPPRVRYLVIKMEGGEQPLQKDIRWFGLVASWIPASSVPWQQRRLAVCWWASDTAALLWGLLFHSAVPWCGLASGPVCSFGCLQQKEVKGLDCVCRRLSAVRSQVQDLRWVAEVTWFA